MKNTERAAPLIQDPRYMAAVLTWCPELASIYTGGSRFTYAAMPGGNAASSSLKVDQQTGIAFYYGSTGSVAVGLQRGDHVQLTPLDLAMHIRGVSDHRVGFRTIRSIMEGRAQYPKLETTFDHLPDPTSAPAAAISDDAGDLEFQRLVPPVRTQDEVDAEIEEFCRAFDITLHEGDPPPIKHDGARMDFLEAVHVPDPNGAVRFTQGWWVCPKTGAKTSRYMTFTSDGRYCWKAVFSPELRPYYFGEGRTGPRGDRPIEVVSGVHGQRVGAICIPERDWAADLFGDAKIITDPTPLMCGQIVVFSPDDDDVDEGAEFSGCEAAMRRRAKWLEQRGVDVRFRRPADPRSEDGRLRKPNGAPGGDIVDLCADHADVEGGTSKAELREGVAPSDEGRARVRDWVAGSAKEVDLPDGDASGGAGEAPLDVRAGEARAAWIEARDGECGPDETGGEYQARVLRLKEEARRLERELREEGKRAERRERVDDMGEQRRQQRIAKFGTDEPRGYSDAFREFLMDNDEYAFYGHEEASGPGGKLSYRFQAKEHQRHMKSVPATVEEVELNARLGTDYIERLLFQLRCDTQAGETLEEKSVRLLLADSLRRVADTMPKYNPHSGRGYGITASDPVYNLGKDYIDPERGLLVPHDFSIGDAARFRDLDSLSPLPSPLDLSPESAEAAAEICRAWMRRRWRRSPLEGLIAFGWACAALVAGGLHRRPALILEGGKNAGKSDLMEVDFAGLWADHRADVPHDRVGQPYVEFLAAVRDPSSAGIRQNYGHNSQGMAVDDPNPAESSQTDAQRAEAVFDLSDACFGGGRSPRGTPSGAGRPDEPLRCMIAFSTGRPIPIDKQGRNRRMIRLQMTSPKIGFDEDELVKFSQDRKRLAELYRKHSAEVRARVIHSVHTIITASDTGDRENLFFELYRRLGDHEVAQTLAPCIAAARAATTHGGVCLIEEELGRLGGFLIESRESESEEPEPTDAAQIWLNGKVDLTIPRKGGSSSPFGDDDGSSAGDSEPNGERYRVDRRALIQRVWDGYCDSVSNARNAKWITPSMMQGEWPDLPNADPVRLLLKDGCMVGTDGTFALDPNSAAVKSRDVPHQYRRNMRSWLVLARGADAANPARIRRADGTQTRRGVAFSRETWDLEFDPDETVVRQTDDGGWDAEDVPL